MTVRGGDIQPGAAHAGIRVRDGLPDDPIQLFVEAGTAFGGTIAAIETDDNALVHMISYSKPKNLPLWLRSAGIKQQEEVIRDLGGYQTPIATPDNTALDSQYDANEINIIQNMRTRINELENRLMKAGIL